MYKQKVGSPINAILLGVYIAVTALIVFGIIDCIVRESCWPLWWRLAGFAVMIPVCAIIWRFSRTRAEYRFLGREIVVWCINRHFARRMTIRLNSVYAIDGRKMQGVDLHPMRQYNCCATLRGRLFHQMSLTAELDSGAVVRVILEPDEKMRKLIFEGVQKAI